jgi:hypothetical protein
VYLIVIIIVCSVFWCSFFFFACFSLRLKWNFMLVSCSSPPFSFSN